MTRRQGQLGFSLVEMLVVMAIMAVLFAIGITGAKMVIQSFQAGANVRHIIGASLSNARALAAKYDTYAGVRFGADAEGRQYMTLIVYDYEATGLASGFRAMPDRKPTPLPENVMVMDTRIRTSTDSASDSSDTPIQVGVIPNVNSAASDQNIDEDFELTDAQTFSVVFSKSGRLVTHDVRVWNRDGVYDDTSTDDIFNTLDNINVNQTGRFIQDNYPAMGLGQEPSRNCFWVFNRNEFEAVPATQRWSGFLRFQEELYVSPFTGEIVNKEKTNP